MSRTAATRWCPKLLISMSWARKKILDVLSVSIWSLNSSDSRFDSLLIEFGWDIEEMSMMDTIWFIVFQLYKCQTKCWFWSIAFSSLFFLCLLPKSIIRVICQVRSEGKFSFILKPFLYIISTYCLISTKMMEAGGWTQHDDWLKCSVFIHRKAGKIEDNL